MSRENEPIVKKLDSGYWFVRWNREVWAQWPEHRGVRLDDFFHHTGTDSRIQQCDTATGDIRADAD